MLVLAKSIKDQEFFYNARSAHKVSKAKAEFIKNELNRLEWKLSEGEVWYIHEVDQYDTAYDYASYQKFFIRNGCLKESRR